MKGGKDWLTREHMKQVRHGLHYRSGASVFTGNLPLSGTRLNDWAANNGIELLTPARRMEILAKGYDYDQLQQIDDILMRITARISTWDSVTKDPPVFRIYWRATNLPTIKNATTFAPRPLSRGSHKKGKARYYPHVEVWNSVFGWSNTMPDASLGA